VAAVPCWSARSAHDDDHAAERRRRTAMCLNCGCMRAHDDMGKPDVNITYETVKRAAEANGKSIEETLETIARTADKDRGEHPAEYATSA
jgi:hypothetical protein